MNLLVNEVARESGLHRNTIKRAEKRGLISSQRDVNGWRRYSRETVETLRRLYVRNEARRESEE